MKKSTFLIFLVFLCGVICANILGIVSGRELGAMSEYFMHRYLYANIQGSELFPFLFYKRAPEMLLLVFVSIGIYGTLIVDGYICYLSFSVGFLAVIAIMNYGIKGILIMFGFFFPQWLLYAPALYLWRYELRYYKGMGQKAEPLGSSGKRHMKLAVVWMLASIFILAGLFAESYVNPFLLQKIVRALG